MTRTYIYYTKFSEMEIFSDPVLNVFCNQIFTGLINVLDESTVVNNLVVDGGVALLLQAKEVQHLSGVKFLTASKAIFQTLKTNLAGFGASEYHLSDAQVIMKFKERYFEFNLVSVIMKTVDYEDSGILLNADAKQ